MLIEREKLFGKLEFVTSRELQRHCDLHGKNNILLKVVFYQKPSFLSGELRPDKKLSLWSRTLLKSIAT